MSLRESAIALYDICLFGAEITCQACIALGVIRGSLILTQKLLGEDETDADYAGGFARLVRELGAAKAYVV